MAEPDENNVFLQDSVTHLSAAAIQINEMFIHLKDAGFSKNEALYICAFVFSGMLSNFEYDAPEDDDDLDFPEENDDNDGEIPF